MPALQTIPNVEIARAGTWNASTGAWVCTPEDIADAVRAAGDPTFRTPVIKLGHTDPRFDGEPAVGRIENLRASEDGQVLLGDLVGVPAWLAEIIPSAFNSRSVEAALGVKVEGGHEYRMVVEAVALLGVALPAIQNLNDLRQLYQVSGDLDGYVAASRIAASVPAGTGADAIVKATATIDQLLQAVRGWITGKGLSDYAWVREVYTDRVIVDDDQGRLWAVSWTEADGNFTFGDPQAVEVQYVPLANTVAAAAVHRARLPLLYDRGQVSAAVADSSAEHHERNPVPDLTDREKRIREALGLGEDATAEQVEEATLARITAPPPEQTPPPAGTVPAPTTTVVPAEGAPAATPQLVTASAADDPRLAEVTRLSTELAAMKKRDYERERDQVLASALADGKIRPADRESWLGRYDKAPELIADVLASMAPGTAIPVAAKGTRGDDSLPDEDKELWAQISGQLGINEGGMSRG